MTLTYRYLESQLGIPFTTLREWKWLDRSSVDAARGSIVANGKGDRLDGGNARQRRQERAQRREQSGRSSRVRRPRARVGRAESQQGNQGSEFVSRDTSHPNWMLSEGQTLHGFCDGTWSSGDAMQYILGITGPCKVIICTWTVSSLDINRVKTLVDAGSIGEVYWLLDRSFPSRHAQYMHHLKQKFSDDEIRLWNAHCKFTIFLGGDLDVLYITSANMNRNRRLEHYVIYTEKSIIMDYVSLVQDLIDVQLPGEGYKVTHWESVARGGQRSNGMRSSPDHITMTIRSESLPGNKKIVECMPEDVKMWADIQRALASSDSALANARKTRYTSDQFVHGLIDTVVNAIHRRDADLRARTTEQWFGADLLRELSLCADADERQRLISRAHRAQTNYLNRWQDDDLASVLRQAVSET